MSDLSNFSAILWWEQVIFKRWWWWWWWGPLCSRPTHL